MFQLALRIQLDTTYSASLIRLSMDLNSRRGKGMLKSMSYFSTTWNSLAAHTSYAFTTNTTENPF